MVLPKSMRVPGGRGFGSLQTAEDSGDRGSGDSAEPPSTIREVLAAQTRNPLMSACGSLSSPIPLSHLLELFLSSRAEFATHQADPLSGWKCDQFLPDTAGILHSFNCWISHVSHQWRCSHHLVQI